MNCIASDTLSPLLRPGSLEILGRAALAAEEVYPELVLLFGEAGSDKPAPSVVFFDRKEPGMLVAYGRELSPNAIESMRGKRNTLKADASEAERAMYVPLGIPGESYETVLAAVCVEASHLAAAPRHPSLPLAIAGVPSERGTLGEVANGLFLFARENYAGFVRIPPNELFEGIGKGYLSSVRGVQFKRGLANRLYPVLRGISRAADSTETERLVAQGRELILAESESLVGETFISRAACEAPRENHPNVAAAVESLARHLPVQAGLLLYERAEAGSPGDFGKIYGAFLANAEAPEIIRLVMKTPY
ncbi:MAG: hypothetical protein V1820_02075 [archaeon]